LNEVWCISLEEKELYEIKVERKILLDM